MSKASRVPVTIIYSADVPLPPKEEWGRLTYRHPTPEDDERWAAKMLARKKASE